MKINRKKLIVLGAVMIIGISAAVIFQGYTGPRAEKNVAGTEMKIPIAELNCEGDTRQKYLCYENYYKETTLIKGVETAFADMKERYNNDSYVTSNCHPLVHVIGNTAARNFTDVSEAFANGDAFCWSGYYHGIMETIIPRIGKANLANELDGICEELREKRSIFDVVLGRNVFDYYNCVHGLGHGIMGITYNELFESLDLCDRLSREWEQISCGSGVFMENIIIENTGIKSDYLKPEDPVYPCNDVSEKHRKYCFRMQTSYMLKIFHNDYQKVFALCKESAGNYIDECYQSLGRDASGSTASNIQKVKELCLSGEDFRQQSHCIIGAANDFLPYFNSNAQAYELCAAIPEELQSICFDAVKNSSKLYTFDE